MNRIAATLAGFAALVAANCAWAQSTFPTQNGTVNAPGEVNMCRNSVGISVPCSELTPLPVKVTGGIPTSPYPPGSYPITCIASGSTAAVVGTCAAAPGKYTYLCGVDVSAIGGTAAVGPIVIAGLTGGSFTYQASATAAGGLALSREWSHCLVSASVNTAITITTTADGTATAVNVNGYGFQL